MHVKCPMVNSVSLFALRQFPDLCMLVGKNKLVRQVRQVVLISRFMVSRLLVRQVVKQWANGKHFFPDSCQLIQCSKNSSLLSATLI